MPARKRLPNRRENETVDLHFEGQRYHVTVGFAPDGKTRIPRADVEAALGELIENWTATRMAIQ